MEYQLLRKYKNFIFCNIVRSLLRLIFKSLSLDVERSENYVHFSLDHMQVLKFCILTSTLYFTNAEQWLPFSLMKIQCPDLFSIPVLTSIKRCFLY